MHSNTKRCPKCKVCKDLDAFYVNNTRADGRSGHCKVCQATYSASPRGKASNAQAIRAHRRTLQDLLRQLKDAPCLDCGIRFPPVCMQYDHLDPTTKRRTVSQWVARRNLPEMLEEIALCELVCANCHAIRTETRRLALSS